MDWQPIDTAPKDRVIRIRTNKDEVLAAFWNKDDTDFPWYFLEEGSQDAHLDWAVTHVNAITSDQVVAWKPLED